jgi:hypothetical protein
MQEELAAQNQAFVRDVFHKAEKDRRDTQLQSIVTVFNLVTTQMGQFMSNPKFMAKAFYYGVCVFGAFHLTRMSVALMT